MAERYVFESELLFKSNGQAFVQQVRGIFSQLRAEARRSIEAGTSAGIPQRYAATVGGVSAAIASARDLGRITPIQETAALRSVANATTRSFGGLNNYANRLGVQLGRLSESDIGKGFQATSARIREGAQRLYNANLRAADAADKLAAAERKSASRQAELDAKRAAGSKTRTAADLNAESVRYTVGGLGLTPAQLAAAQRGVTGQPDPTQSRYSRGGLGVKQTEIDAINKNLANATAESALAEKTRALGIRAQTARREAGSQAFLQAQAQATLAERQLATSLAQATRQQAIAQGLGGGSFFQRLQSQLHAKGGDTRLPSDYQKFGQFLGQKALITGGFALSGAVLYGAISGFKEIIREASALQRELAIVKSQFDALGDTEGFENFSKKMVQISVETGVAANEVARVSRQLAGVFRIQQPGQQSRPDFDKAASEARQALKLSQVTGLPYQEITDSLTALTVTFGTSFTQIGDQAIGLEQRLGVLSTELIRFAADVAPVAKTFGLEFEQIIGLGAIAQQRSGVSGGALAENLNRSLPSIQKGQIDLARLLAQQPATQGFTAPILDAIGAAEGGKVIEQLALAYAKMTANQRQALGDILGGERNAKAFFAILEGGQDTLAVLGGNLGDFGGKLEGRFTDFQSTVEFAFQRAGRALEQFGLALFNSGLADGLKVIADAGADVAKVAALLLEVFSGFNDVLGGLPIKLLAVYTTLRLITALGGGVGGIRTLIAGLAVGGRGAAVSPAVASGALYGFGAPAAAAATRAPLFTSAPANALKGLYGVPVGVGVAGTGVKAALAGFAATVAPAVAALAVAQLAQTVQAVQGQIKEAREHLLTVTAEKIKQGVSGDEILRQIKAAGGDDQPTLAGIPAPFITGATPFEAELDRQQKANAERQGKELKALLEVSSEEDRRKLVEAYAKGQHPGGVSPDVLAGLQRAGLPALIQSFIDDPANDAKNEGIQAILKFIAEGGGTPQQVSALLAIANQYANATDQGKAAAAGIAYAPVLAEIQARYAIGDASLQELLEAERHNVELLKGTLAHASGDSITKAAQDLASAQKELDNSITTAAARAAEITIKIATLRGENVGAATTAARITELRAAISQGASPDAQLDAGFAVLEAQAKELDEFINSPVIVDGIARAATAAEKAARALQGTAADPEARQAIVRAQVSMGANLVAVKALAQQKGQGLEQTIDEVVALILAGDQAVNGVLQAAMEAQIAAIEQAAKLLAFDYKGQIAKAMQRAGDALRSAIAGLGTKSGLGGIADPGPTIRADTSGFDTAGADDAANEAKAYADALIAQQRARAHGDPIAEAQIAIQAAQQAIARATKPSEREAGIAQLIEAQNQLDDANHAAFNAQISYSAALGKYAGDPVGAARHLLELAQRAVAQAHGAAAESEAAAALLDAQQSVTDAIRSVFEAQANLVSAIAEAAGNTVEVARQALKVAQQRLADLAAQGRTDSATDPDVANAQAEVIRAKNSVSDARVQTEERNIDFLLQMERITTAQAIARLQGLLSLVTGDEAATQELLLKIKSLQASLGQSLQFNLPSEIKLPTLYEARRLSQSGTPLGPGSYQDNRQISVQVFAQTNASPAQIGAAVADALGPAPNTTSTFAKRY